MNEVHYHLQFYDEDRSLWVARRDWLFLPAKDQTIQFDGGCFRVEEVRIIDPKAPLANEVHATVFVRRV